MINTERRGPRALSKIGPPAVQPLIAYLQAQPTMENADARLGAVKALGGIGPDANAAVPILSKIVEPHGKDWALVIQAAARALVQIKGDQALNDPNVTLALLWANIQEFRVSRESRRLID